MHAKIYLFDEKEAVISSSNLTNGGLLNNFEYGFCAKDENIISKVASDFKKISSSDKIGDITLDNISKVREIFAEISIILPQFNLSNSEKNLNTIVLDSAIITSHLTGWVKEVFICLNDLEKECFSLEEMRQFEPKLKKTLSIK